MRKSVKQVELGLAKKRRDQDFVTLRRKDDRESALANKRMTRFGSSTAPTPVPKSTSVATGEVKKAVLATETEETPLERALGIMRLPQLDLKNVGLYHLHHLLYNTTHDYVLCSCYEMGVFDEMARHIKSIYDQRGSDENHKRFIEAALAIFEIVTSKTTFYPQLQSTGVLEVLMVFGMHGNDLALSALGNLLDEPMWIPRILEQFPYTKVIPMKLLALQNKMSCEDPPRAQNVDQLQESLEYFSHFLLAPLKTDPDMLVGSKRVRNDVEKQEIERLKQLKELIYHYKYMNCAFPVMVEMLSLVQPFPKLYKSYFEIMKDLSCDEASYDCFFDSGLAKLVMHAATSADKKIATNAVSILGMLMSSSDDEKTQAHTNQMLSLGALQVCNDLLSSKHHTDNAFKKEVVYMLSNIALGKEEQCAQIFQCPGLVEKLLVIFNDTTENSKNRFYLIENVAWVLYAITDQLKMVAEKTFLIEHGCLQALLLRLKEEPRKAEYLRHLLLSFWKLIRIVVPRSFTYFNLIKYYPDFWSDIIAPYETNENSDIAYYATQIGKLQSRFDSGEEDYQGSQLLG